MVEGLQISARSPLSFVDMRHEADAPSKVPRFPSSLIRLFTRNVP